jgi:hypothetical protein
MNGPYFIAEPYRADGERGVGGCWRREAEDRAAQMTAPEIWEKYCQYFPGYWDQKFLEAAKLPGGATYILGFLPDPAAADREPLRRHLNNELRSGV